MQLNARKYPAILNARLDGRDWLEAQVIENLMFTGERVHDTMRSSLRAEDAARWFVGEHLQANDTALQLRTATLDDGNERRLLTEASVAVSGRRGAINTPWWSFTPERANYIAQPSPVIGNALRPGIRELYVWGGVKLRARAYSVFLQGQFRDSEVEVDADRVERLIGEAWLGLTWQFSQEYRLSYVVRYQAREIKDGPASRDLLWSGFVVSRDL